MQGSTRSWVRRTGLGLIVIVGVAGISGCNPGTLSGQMKEQPPGPADHPGLNRAGDREQMRPGGPQAGGTGASGAPGAAGAPQR